MPSKRTATEKCGLRALRNSAADSMAHSRPIGRPRCDHVPCGAPATREVFDGNNKRVGKFCGMHAVSKEAALMMYEGALKLAEGPRGDSNG